MKNRKFQPPEVCPVCGEDVPPRSLACPECGADEHSGWREDAYSYEGLDLPDEKHEFDYDDFMKREFGEGGAEKRPKLNPLWVVIGILLLISFLWQAFLH